MHHVNTQSRGTHTTDWTEDWAIYKQNRKQTRGEHICRRDETIYTNCRTFFFNEVYFDNISCLLLF